MFKRLLFGIKCASDYFSKMFSDIFADMEDVVIHMDNVLVFTKTYGEHMKTV